MKKTLSIILVLLLAIGMVAALTACSIAYAEGPANDSGDIVTYKATFVTNYGSTPVDSRGTPMETNLRIIPEEPVTTRPGYVFIGWYLTADWTDTVVEFPYIMKSDTTFYAKWQSAGIKAVSTVKDLKDIGEDAASLAGSYYLTNDIDLAGIDWIPIGLNYDLLYDEEGELEYIQLTGENAPQAFTGTFDGNGYTIRNMTIKPFATEKEANYLPYGLFARLGRKSGTASYSCTVKNVRFTDFNIELPGHLSRFYIGALAGKMEAGTVTNCHVAGNVINSKIVYESSIWDDFFGSYAEPTERTDLGGLIGRLTGGTVSSCSAQGKVTSESVAESLNAGGLIGCNENGTITKCYASSTVRARYAGGLVGKNCSTITDCFATGNVDCSLSYPCVAGGLVGYNVDEEITTSEDSSSVYTKAIIERCYSSGNVSARISGGLVGINIFSYMRATGGIINDCYSMSTVFASEYAGGLIGRAEADVSVNGSQNTSSLVTDNFFFIKNCISYGDVEVNVENVTYYYIDDNGDEQSQTQEGVYYSVFAGGFIGHAYEPRISGCISFGNVTAVSKRPTDGGVEMKNTTFADNFIGHSTNIIDVSRNTYVADDVEVLRNGEKFTAEHSSAMTMGYKLTIGESLSSSSFLMSIGFSTGVWNLENINIADGRYPALR